MNTYGTTRNAVGLGVDGSGHGNDGSGEEGKKLHGRRELRA